MKVALTIFERLFILNRLLPQEGRAEYLRVVQTLISVLGLTEEEMAALSEPGKSFVFDEAAARLAKDMAPQEFDLGPASLVVIAERLTKMEQSDREGEGLPLPALALYDQSRGWLTA